MKRYYYDECTFNVLEKYATIWKGFLKKKNIDDNWIKCDELRKIDDLFAEKYDINFYTYLDEDYLYISLCQDTKYYYYQFEKDIIKMIKDIQKLCQIEIGEGCFEAWECKPYADSYKYTIYREEEKLKLKKIKVNIEKYENQKKVKIKHK